jgi:chromosome segregation ATPase
MITLTENFLRENVHPEIFDEFPFLLAEIVPPKILSDEKFKEFENFFEQKYHDIEQNRVIPMNLDDAEIIVGKGSSIKTSSGEHTGKIKETEKQDVDINKFLEEMKQRSELTQAAQKLEEMEKEQLRDEIRKYEKIIKDKDERIRNLELQIQNSASITSQLGVTQQAMQKIEELSQLLGEKDQELNEWKEKAMEMNEKLFVHQDTIAKMTEMSMLQSEEMQDLSRKNKSMTEELKNLKQEKESLKQEINTLNQQIESIKNLLHEKDIIISELSHANKMQKYTENEKPQTTAPQNIIIQDASEGASKAIEELQRQLEAEREEKKQLQLQIGEYKSVTIELKKDIKIARREIESLRKKLDSNTVI